MTDTRAGVLRVTGALHCNLNTCSLAPAAAVTAAGATNAGRGPAGVDATVLDVDGVSLELTQGDVPAPTLRYARLVTADLAATTEWYTSIGFASRAERTIRWATADGEVD